MSDKKKNFLVMKFGILSSEVGFDYESKLDIYSTVFLSLRNVHFTMLGSCRSKDRLSDLPHTNKLNHENKLKFGKLTDRDLLLLTRTEREFFLEYQKEHTSEDGLVDNEALAKISSKFTNVFDETLFDSGMLSLPEILDYSDIFYSEFKDEWRKGKGSKGKAFFMKDVEWTTGEPLKLYYFILMNGYKAGHFIFDEDGSMLVTKVKKVQDGQLTLSDENMHGSLELVSIHDQLRKPAEPEGTSITGFLLFGIMIASILVIVALLGTI